MRHITDFGRAAGALGAEARLRWTLLRGGAASTPLTGPLHRRTIQEVSARQRHAGVSTGGRHDLTTAPTRNGRRDRVRRAGLARGFQLRAGKARTFAAVTG